MPRTKQNHPKNLKDKIEEAQKELKDPKGARKGNNESISRRNSDVIKGLKRKTVVAENQLKKIPKSPVKQQVQCKSSISKTTTAATFGSLSKQISPSCSLFKGPSPNTFGSLDQKCNPKDVQQGGKSAVGLSLKEQEPLFGIENDKLTKEDASIQKLLSGCEKRPVCEGARELQLTEIKDRQVTNKEGSISTQYHSSAPLDVLLKAMEPDFSTLTEGKKQIFSFTPIRKSSDSDLSPNTIVNDALKCQQVLMQSTLANEQESYPEILTTTQVGVQSSSHSSPVQTLLHGLQYLMPLDSSLHHKKPGITKRYSTGPLPTLTHAPVPSGSNTLPQSQPPMVHTCQSLSASVPSPIQVPVTPGYSAVQMATVVNFGLDQTFFAKDHKPKKQGKYVCEYCSRACAKPSVLLKHIRSHTGERPYPCITCGFSFKTKSNLYKHKKSHAHAIKLGLMVRSDSGSGPLSQQSDKVLGINSDVEESEDSEEESSTADPDSSQSSITALSECSLQGAGLKQGEGDCIAGFEPLKSMNSQKSPESKAIGSLPKVVVYPVNNSPLRADSPRLTDSVTEQATAQQQKEFPIANMRSNVMVLSSLKEVDGISTLQDVISEDEDQQCVSPPGGSHANLQRQQATDSQQQQGKGLLSPRSLGSTDSGYFSRSESADQAMSPPSPFVKITPPDDLEVAKVATKNPSAVDATVMQLTTLVDKPQIQPGQMRPPLENKARSLEERISKLISDNEAVVDDKQLDSVKPRRTSLSRRGSIDSPKSYIFKDSFQFDLKPMGRRSSSSSDIPKSPFTPTEKSKPVFLLSVPHQYPSMDCLPITRSNSMPTTPGHLALPFNTTPQPHPLRICHSFDDKIGSFNDDVFSSAPPTPNPAVHPRTLVRQVAIEDFSTSDSLPSFRSMDEGYQGSSSFSLDIVQRSKSFEYGPEKGRKSQQGKGTMYECETCRNRYRKLENFENHKKFYCSELHGPKNKSLSIRETEQDPFQHSVSQQPLPQKIIGISGAADQLTSIRKRRKMKSVGDDDDQSPTDKVPPCSTSFDSCQLLMGVSMRPFSQHSVMVDHQSAGKIAQTPQIHLILRGTDSSESRLSPISESQICSTNEREELQRQGSGTSVIRHTNSLSRPNSFEMSECIERSPVVDLLENDTVNISKIDSTTVNVSQEGYHEKMSILKCNDQDEHRMVHNIDLKSTEPGECIAAVPQLRLVRQNNIQVPEILVTEEPDRERDNQGNELGEKPLDTFNWPQRSESLSKLPTEKLPPKKKRIRLAQLEHSSGESSFESNLSPSLSRDSSLSRCSSISASFDRDELPRSDSLSRVEYVSKIPDPPGLPIGSNTLGVPSMRRAASEQISCTQPSVEITCDYRSKSFDCVSMSSMETVHPKSPQAALTVQVPLIERRRGPLVRQMSLKIGPDSRQHIVKNDISLQSVSTVVSPCKQRSQLIVSKLPIPQPCVLHSGDTTQQKNQNLIQNINLGCHTQHCQVQGLPHPWHQTSKVHISKTQRQHVVSVTVNQDDTKHMSAEYQERKSFVPKYQLQCPQRPSHTHSFSNTQGIQITLPILTIPNANQNVSVSKSSDVKLNVYVTQQRHLSIDNSTQSDVLPVGIHGDPSSINQAGPFLLPQILITHEQINSSSVLASKRNSSLCILDGDIKTGVNINDRPQSSVSPLIHEERQQSYNFPQMKDNIVSNSLTQHSADIQSTQFLGSLQCTQKMASVSLCPQQEPTASSKRMLSPANSLDIAMEKHQKRAKDEHGAACLTDGRSIHYLNSKMTEMTRQRKLTLVRQVCTTEPATSPIETEFPPQQQFEKLELDKDSQVADPCKSMRHESTAGGLETEALIPTFPPASSSTLRIFSGAQGCSVLAISVLKSHDKVEWYPAKSPPRPSLSFNGQVKLASSVSVVNARDSHRLSFPSLKTATTFTWCYLMKRKPLHVPQTNPTISAYSTWVVSSNNPNPLGLPTKVVMSLFDSKQVSKKIYFTQAITTSIKSDILTYSSKLKDVIPKGLTPQKCTEGKNTITVQAENQLSCESDKDLSLSKTEPRRVKIFDGGYKSNEDYIYVRGRGRGKYICEECGIRCKKPSMLRKHIRTHSDVRPYHCAHCNFSFKTKGNLTKHMKSKAHSKKCLEMGVSVGLVDDLDTEDSGDRGQSGSGDHPDSEGEDSDFPEDEDNDVDEDEEEDSQAESGLSTNPSVCASPQHFPPAIPAVPPSALLAQMSINPTPQALPQAHISDSQDLNTECVPKRSCTPLCISGGCSSPSPLPFSSSYPHTSISDVHSSDMESVHMMSPMSPSGQMSIDYPDFDDPPSPPLLGKVSKIGQDCPILPVHDAGVPVDRSTQTSTFVPQEATAHSHLFSHLPLHSQQPSSSPYSMVPIGGIQLVPAGLAAYSTFLPIQAGPVQLTIPAVSVIHPKSSTLPGPCPQSNNSLHPEGSTTQPLVQEPVGTVLPYFPMGSVTGLQGLGASHAFQPVGVEALNCMGLAGTGLTPKQIYHQQGLTTLSGLQLLTASPTPQSSTACPQPHISGLQILNITLPALLPALSPLSESQANLSSTLPGHSTPKPAAVSILIPATAQPVQEMTLADMGSTVGLGGSDHAQIAETGFKVKASSHLLSTSPQRSPGGGSGEPCLQKQSSRQRVTEDFSEASSDDEDRLVIAT